MTETFIKGSSYYNSKLDIPDEPTHRMLQYLSSLFSLFLKSKKAEA